LLSPVTEPRARILTTVEIRDRQLQFQARIECQPTGGELRTLTVNLCNWEGEEVRLEASGVARKQERRRPSARDRSLAGNEKVGALRGGDRTWRLDLQPGVTTPYALTLTGSMPLEEAEGGIAMPEVTVAGANPIERWWAIRGTDLAVEN